MSGCMHATAGWNEDTRRCDSVFLQAGAGRLRVCSRSSKAAHLTAVQCSSHITGIRVPALL
eukprot:3385941-Alexandrium_andersonii.AAC.1